MPFGRCPRSSRLFLDTHRSLCGALLARPSPRCNTFAPTSLGGTGVSEPEWPLTLFRESPNRYLQAVAWLARQDPLAPTLLACIRQVPVRDTAVECCQRTKSEANNTLGNRFVLGALSFFAWEKLRGVSPKPLDRQSRDNN